MKISLLKDGYREIKYSFKRFLSILLMSFLGVGFFAGIRAASYDMKATLDEYYKLAKVFDIEIISTLGLTYEDIESLKKLDGIEEISSGFSKDILLRLNGNSYAAKLMTYNSEMNLALLNKEVDEPGLIPEQSETISWCLVDRALVEKTGKSVGDSLELIETQVEEDRVLRTNRFKIIGIVDSPFYMSADRGSSSLGSGKTDFYIYVPPHSVKSDYFTQLYIRVEGAESTQTDSLSYLKKVEAVEEAVKGIKKEREAYRYNKLKGEGEEKINKAQRTFDTESNDAQLKIDKAKAELKDAELKIKDAEQEIKDGKKKLTKAKRELKKQTKEAYDELKKAGDELSTAKKKLETKLGDLALNKQELLDKKEILLESYATLERTVEELEAAGLSKDEIEAGVKENKEELSSSSLKIESGLEEIEEGEKKLLEKLQGVKDAEAELPVKKREIDQKISDARKEIKEHQGEIEEGENKLKESKQELKEAKVKLADKEEEFIEKTTDAKEKLDEAREKLNDLKYPKWHIFDRRDNYGYDGFIRDIKSVAKLGGLFPLILFLIAALISLNSMTRMVEEQRVELGTLKALGYNKFDIAMKYLRYAALASVIGGILGMSLGFRLIPKIIWGMYEINYSIPNQLILLFDWRNGSIGLLMSVFCVLAATLAALLKELMEVPSQLMRPKAPKLGKRVLLERIQFLWKRFSFSQKVTIRNIFRYKKRFLMTIIGVMGCTALIVSGFGLRDSVSYLVEGQYGDVFNFDMMVRLSDDASGRVRKKVKQEISDMESTEYLASVVMTAMKVTGNKEKTYDSQLIVTDSIEELRNVIRIKDKKTRKDENLQEGKIYITDKLAELTGVQVGDEITLSDENDKASTFTVGGVLENYLSHYVYMSKEMYESNFQEYKLNTLILKNKEGVTESEVSAEILELDPVDAVILSSTVIDMMSVMMQSLNYVVAVLIIAAALLAFIVLFNLANLNISERKREIATIKVLGFYDKEVWEYLDRETIILTIIGILFGLPGGHYLNALIVKTCEVDFVRFNIDLSVLSYVFSSVIALAFSFFVNMITYFSLKKVNMIESLKSVE